MAVEKLILFRLNEQVYGMNIDFVSAIEFAAAVVRVPNAPSYIEGMINLRGEVIPVYSLHKKFNLTVDEAKTESQLIITKSKEHTVAILVDAVDEIYVVEEGKFLPSPAILRSKETAYMEGVVTASDRLILCVDAEQLLSETELQNMESFFSQMTKSEG